MRWMLAASAVLAAAVLIAGCGGNSAAPAPPVQVVNSYLGDGFLTGGTEPMMNMGMVVGADGSVEGAGFTSTPDGGPAVPENDLVFTGTLDGSNHLSASGSMVGNNGSVDAGSITLTGAVGTDGSFTGTFDAAGIGTGTWRAFPYPADQMLGCYMGTYTGDRQGVIAILNLPSDPSSGVEADTAIVLKENAQPRTDFFLASTAAVLTAPTPPATDYTLLADDSWYDTGMVITGAVGATSASGDWQQPEGTGTISGTWSASRPAGRAATGRGIAAGPLRVKRVRR